MRSNVAKKDPSAYLREELYPRLFTVHVVPANGAVMNDRARRKNWTLKYQGPDTSEKGPLEIRSRDLVRFVMPARKDGGAETGWVTFIRCETEGSVEPGVWPFGANSFRVVGSRLLPCSLPPLAMDAGDHRQPIPELRFRYSIYLEDYDDLVDENSTPVIIIKDP